MTLWGEPEGVHKSICLDITVIRMWLTTSGHRIA